MFKKLIVAALLSIAPLAAVASTPYDNITGHAPVELMQAKAGDTQPTREETFKAIAQAMTVAPKAKESRVTVTNDYGGSVIEFITKYNAIQQSGGKIAIPDICISACTLVTGLVDADRVCVSPHTVFGFHSASVLTFGGPVYSEEGTHLIWAIYPQVLREALTKLGWDGGEHPGLVYIRGTDLYALCD